MMEPAEDEQRPFPDPEHSIAPRKPRTVGGAVYLAVLVVTVLGIVLIVLDRWRLGLNVVGGAMLCGAVARLALRQDDAGMLGVRRKVVDVLTLAAVGGALMVLAGVIPDQPRL